VPIAVTTALPRRAQRADMFNFLGFYIVFVVLSF
jgi:hypothetical protein